MTTDFYTGLQARAISLLGRYGQDVTYEKTTSGNVDPIEGIVSRSTTSYTVKGAIFPLSGKEFVGELTVQADDQKMLISTAAFTPDIGDKVTCNGVTYSVINIKETAPAGIAVIFELVIRK